MAPVTLKFSSRPIVLPQELSDYIIENLHHELDCDSLKQCGLVCKAWLYASRMCQFERVNLTPTNLSSFLALINLSSSSIPAYVRRLEIRSFRCKIFDSFSSTQLLASLGCTITSLHLRDVVFDSFLDVLNFICSFSRLGSLTLDQVTWGNFNQAKSNAAIHSKILPHTVDHLRLHDIPLRQFIGWLNSHTKVPKVSHLDVGPLRAESTPFTGTYLVSLNSDLKHVALAFGIGNKGHICARQAGGWRHLTEHTEHGTITPPSNEERFMTHYGVEACSIVGSLTGLYSLQINDYIHHEDYQQSTASFWGPRAIASIRAPQLRHIILGISLRRVGELDKFRVCWEFLDVVFTSSMDYPLLTSIEFQISGRVDVEGLASLISLRLPACAKRGLLFFRKLV
ncbi:hypothetical protein B0H34DRAFT_462542 [Crassisporium funariophilum]|nr:hypothetical protein B0H34DRAFT_462542 [Crassisporium funariophilum]